MGVLVCCFFGLVVCFFLFSTAQQALCLEMLSFFLIKKGSIL